MIDPYFPDPEFGGIIFLPDYDVYSGSFTASYTVCTERNCCTSAEVDVTIDINYPPMANPDFADTNQMQDTIRPCLLHWICP